MKTRMFAVNAFACLALLLALSLCVVQLTTAQSESVENRFFLKEVSHLALVEPYLTRSTHSEVLDQSQTEVNYGFWFEDDVIRWQEFIPELSNITSVEVFIEKRGSPGDMIVEVRTINGTSLAHKTILETESPSYGWARVEFNTPVSVFPGTKYRIYVYSNADSPSVNNRFFWLGTTESSYCSECDNDVIGGWPSYDYAFKTFGMLDFSYKPDLIVQSLTVDEFTSNSIAYSYVIKNIGNAPANLDGPTNEDHDNVGVQAFLSQDTIFNNSGDSPAGGTILGLSPLGELAPGETFIGSFAASTFVDPSTMNYLTLKVDYGDVVDELDEDNNTIATPITSLGTECFGVYSNVVPDGAGSIRISPAPDCPTNSNKWRRDINTKLFFSATPRAGYNFLEWRGHASGDSSSGWFNVPADSDLMISYAIFEADVPFGLCTRIIDLDIGLYRTSVDNSIKLLYEQTLEHAAYALFEATNGQHCIGQVTWHLGGDNLDQTTIDIQWLQSCWPNAHLSRYIGNDPGRIQMCDVYNFSSKYDALYNPTQGGYVLVHEFGHYGYGLCDEYVGDGEGGPCRPGQNDIGVNNSIMNSQWNARPGAWQWLNFSTNSTNNAPTNGHFRAYQASGWATLSRAPGADPLICKDNYCYSMWRDDFPEFRRVDSNEVPSIELDSNGTNANALMHLSHVWQSVSLAALQEQSASINVITPKDLTLNNGAPMIVSFAAYVDGNYVTNLHTADIIVGGQTFAAHDDGTNNDAIANDGIYTIFIDHVALGLGGNIPLSVHLVNDGSGQAVKLPISVSPPPGNSGSPPLPETPSIFDLYETVNISLVGGIIDHGNTPDIATPLFVGSEVHGNVTIGNPDYFFVVELSPEDIRSGYFYQLYVYNKTGEISVNGQNNAMISIPKSGTTISVSGEGYYTVRLVKLQEVLGHYTSYLPLIIK